MTMVFSSADELIAAEGRELGVTDWVEIRQQRIDQFADATDDTSGSTSTPSVPRMALSAPASRTAI